MPRYKHIFFDLDHTLWDFNSNAKTALAEIFTQYDLSEKMNINFDDFYPRYIHHNEILWDRYQKGFINAEELKWRRVWRTLLDFKVADEMLAKKISASFMEILPTKKEVFAHTFEILNYLRDKKYGLHLITNGFEKTQWSKLNNSGLNTYFTHVITSELSNSMKPKKEIFEYAVAKVGCSIEETIMIGDNPDADIQGAINAGMDCIFVNHINGKCAPVPTHTITHLRQLEDIF